MPVDVSINLTALPTKAYPENQDSMTDVQVPGTLSVTLLPPPWKSVAPRSPKCKGRQASLCLRSSVSLPSWGTALYSPPHPSHLPSPQGGSSWASPWTGMGWEWGGRYWGPAGRSWICPFPEVTTRKRVGLSSRILPEGGGEEFGNWRPLLGKPIYHHREKDWRISPECWFSLST